MSGPKKYDVARDEMVPVDQNDWNLAAAFQKKMLDLFPTHARQALQELQEPQTKKLYDTESDSFIKVLVSVERWKELIGAREPFSLERAAD